MKAYEAPSKADAVIHQAREELANRPGAFFRGLKALMDDAKFRVLITQLLSRYDAGREETLAEALAKCGQATADLPDGDYEEPTGEMVP